MSSCPCCGGTFFGESVAFWLASIREVTASSCPCSLVTIVFLVDASVVGQFCQSSILALRDLTCGSVFTCEYALEFEPEIPQTAIPISTVFGLQLRRPYRQFCQEPLSLLRKFFHEFQYSLSGWTNFVIVK